MASSTPPRSASFVRRAARSLESPKLPLFAAFVAATLTAPSLFAGLATEDFVQRAVVRMGSHGLPEALNLFGEARAMSDTEIASRNLECELRGWFPWLTDSRFHASFWRPLASLTHHLDYRAWPDLPVVMHAESILWYAALAFTVALVYRRLVAPRWVAGLAALFYAADDAHGHAVGWLINRNGVMATLFAVLALLAFDRFRRDGWRPGALLTPLFLALGLCSAEFSLCAVGYFVAYLFFVDRAPWGRRLWSAATWGSAVAGWAVAYRFLGHSTRASGLYIDPLAEPAAYAFEMAERAVVLVTGVFGAPPSDAWTHSGLYLQGLLVFWATVFGAFVLSVLSPLLRAERMARFWAAGLVLSLLPACTTFPEDRLLFFAGLGAMPLVAMLVAACFGARADGVPRPRPTVAARALAAGFIGIHGLVAPLSLPYRSLAMFRYERTMREASTSLYAPDRTRLEGPLVLVNGEDYYFTGMMAMTRFARAEPTTRRMLTLAGTLEDVRLTRKDERRLEVRPKFGFLSRVFNRLYTRERVLRGTRIDLGSVRVTVSDVDARGQPTAALFEFPSPLEDPAYDWVIWQKGRYEHFSLPPPGASVVVHG